MESAGANRNGNGSVGDRPRGDLREENVFSIAPRHSCQGMQDVGGNDLSLSDKELFVRLLGNHERRIYAYILSLVPNWADADEIFQETNIRLWRDFSQFDRDTNFGAWATTVAFYQVLTWRKKVARNRLVFDNEMINAIAQRHEQLMPLAESRFLALRDCIAELGERNRELLARCYAPGIPIKDVAQACGRTQASVYKALQRIRGSLRDCIERRMSREHSS